ncbi:hypothetical protein CDL12_20470 [Handroanthus impetiginosus]|uniref:Uncharacterized protein n=1 Tax=Handroanthus impetiginosus TaxID=429701 RepID=A0A2G9GNV0_9LAMI|nr:hypothetical protein CDL12_20470 [Handroanthus impetiginosus]
MTKLQVPQPMQGQTKLVLLIAEFEPSPCKIRRSKRRERTPHTRGESRANPVPSPLKQKN